MSMWNCPICGEDKCRIDRQADGEYLHHYCETYQFHFYLHANIENEADVAYRERILNLITERLLHSKVCKINGGVRYWYFYVNEVCQGDSKRGREYINVAELLKNYPDRVMDKAHRSLLNLSVVYPHYGDVICLMPTGRRLIFEHETNNTHSPGMLRVLEDLGYLKDPSKSDAYSITAQGWQKIDELHKNEQVIQQGFIAMSFREEARPIREAFRAAITQAGYSVGIIDEKEHNNQIVPEIFFEIERSKFVVVDVTYPNYGAYYEAGYAQALGKEVIICCRQDEFDDKDKKPHFDIAQKSTVVWKNEEDLTRRLIKRIEATVK